jgi:hypothetical protein
MSNPMPDRLAEAWRRFDEQNATDPNLELVDGRSLSRELIYSQWLSDWVLRLAPDASEELRLAARAQHLCRWKIPRNSYPMTRAGYLEWRQTLGRFHAETCGDVLREVGYPEEAIARVQKLIRKENFPRDPEGRVLEDALCLVFLEKQLGPLITRMTEEKLLTALRKSWAKMTPRAREIALALPYADPVKALLQRALKELAKPAPPQSTA